MDLEPVVFNIARSLRHSVRGIHISTDLVDRRHLSKHYTAQEPIYAIEIIVNDLERYYTFGVERNGEYRFTRLKEGILEALVYSLREYDFGGLISGDIYQRGDVIGKFVEFQINRKAREIMEDTFSVYADAAKREYGHTHHICSGFKITHYNKGSMTFNSIFDLMVRKVNETKWRRYSGQFVEGQLLTVTDSETKATISLDDVFNA